MVCAADNGFLGAGDEKTCPNGPWVRDVGGHFHRGPGPGFSGVHFHGGHPGPGDMGHMGGGNAGDHGAH
jgi:hypothetical protein